MYCTYCGSEMSEVFEPTGKYDYKTGEEVCTRVSICPNWRWYKLLCHDKVVEGRWDGGLFFPTYYNHKGGKL